jgi:hypothetical protein
MPLVLSSNVQGTFVFTKQRMAVQMIDAMLAQATR